MKLALIGAAAAFTAALATAALSQAVAEDPGYQTQSYSDANRRTPEPRSAPSYDDRNRQSDNAMTPRQADEPDRYRYHGGPKSDD